MSAESQFLREGMNKQAAPFLSADQKVSPGLECLQWQRSTIEPGEEADVSLAEYAHLKDEYLLLIERIKMLEVENSNLRLTVQFYQDLCIDDCG